MSVFILYDVMKICNFFFPQKFSNSYVSKEAFRELIQKFTETSLVWYMDKTMKNAMKIQHLQSVADSSK